jgi:glycosyltransferase A (GT-A) superfamily protein (DUF2064 family)
MNNGELAYTHATTLVLVYKRPRQGHGKQRLAAALGAGATCRLAELLLACALEDLATWPGARVLAPDDAADAQWAQRLMPGAAVVAQGAGNLGQRLWSLDQALRAAGHQRLLFIGSDAPILAPGDLAAAAATLPDHDVVLKPARDGGVVLMGARQPWPTLVDLPWSTERLGVALAERCALAGFSVATLAAGEDVDTPADLARLPAALRADARPARRRLADWLADRPVTQGQVTRSHAC